MNILYQRPRKSLVLFARVLVSASFHTSSLRLKSEQKRELKMTRVDGLRIAVEGCGHGTLHAIYESVQVAARKNSWDDIDLLIIGGDFQAVRNAADLNAMSVPLKFREIGDFHEYYSGKKKAPFLTIFIGGNHEASSHLWELFYGGWVAPNIYYMGAANVLRLGPVRIAGMSGIWKGYNYQKTHHERLPYNNNDIKSIYHVREFDVRKLLQIRTQVDIGISHDWPRGIEKHGDTEKLWKMKPDFKQESKDGTLGNPAATYVMDRLRPPYWFSAHLHCKYAATKEYKDQNSMEDVYVNKKQLEDMTIVDSATPVSSGALVHNEDEIGLNLDDDQGNDTFPVLENSENATAAPGTTAAPVSSSEVPDDLRSLLPASFAKPSAPKPEQYKIPGQPPPPGITNKEVHWLSLDKCLPKRKYLQLLEVKPSSTPSPHTKTYKTTPRYKLSYDPEWLAITRVFAPDLILGQPAVCPPHDLGEAHYAAQIEKEEAWVEENVVQKGKLEIPRNFKITAPIFDKGSPVHIKEQPREYTNPQTSAFCELIGIENKFHASEEERNERLARGPEPEAPRTDSGHGDRGRRGGRGRGGGGSRGGFGGRGKGQGGRGGGRGK